MKASSAVGSAAALAGGIALPFKSKPVAAAVAENVDEKIVSDFPFDSHHLMVLAGC